LGLKGRRQMGKVRTVAKVMAWAVTLGLILSAVPMLGQLVGTRGTMTDAGEPAVWDGALPPMAPESALGGADPARDVNIDKAFSRSDSAFIENNGQLGEGAGLFYAQKGSLSIGFGLGWYAYNLRPEACGSGALVRIVFVGANAVSPVGIDRLDRTSSFFRGNDPSGWVAGVRSFKVVLYEGLWEGIDLRFYFAGGCSSTTLSSSRAVSPLRS